MVEKVTSKFCEVILALIDPVSASQESTAVMDAVTSSVSTGFISSHSGVPSAVG